MTDDVMKDLVTKHDTTITQLVVSVEHLVGSQTDTNKRLEEISKFLAKQVVFSNKIDTMDKDLRESFGRVHKRIDEVEGLQKSDSGCNSVKLLNQEVRAVTKDVTRLVDSCEEQRMKVESLEMHKAEAFKPTTIRWVIGIAVAYTVAFGTYVVQSNQDEDTKITKIFTLLERQIKDTATLMERVSK